MRYSLYAIETSAILLTALAIGINAATAFAETDDPFGNDDPFDVQATVDPFGEAPAKTVPPNGFGEDVPESSGEARQAPPTIWERLRDRGRYSIGNDPETELRMIVAFDESTDLEVQSEPLRYAVDLVAERHDMQIVFDSRGLEDANIDPTSDLVSIELKNVSVRCALQLILEQLELAAIPRGEVLMITSLERAEEMLSTRLYRVPSEWPIKGEQLLSAIATVVRPDSWDDVGGPGTVQSIPGGLLVSNTHSVHRAIDELFGQLARLYRQE